VPDDDPYDGLGDFLLPDDDDSDRDGSPPTAPGWLWPDDQPKRGRRRPGTSDALGGFLPPDDDDSGDGGGGEEQSALSKLLWGDKKRKKGERRSRTRQDPALPGMWQIRAMRAGLLALLLIGAVGGASELLGSGNRAAAEATATATAPQEPEPAGDLGAGGFAELYVAAWLSAGRRSTEAIAPYYPEPVSLADAEAGRYRAARTSTLGLERAEGDDYWSVTVAADVVRTGEDGVEEPVGVRYYTVGVLGTGDGFVATTLPAQVPGPATLATPERAIEDLEAPEGELEAVGRALEGFFDALLTGSGDIERYVVPENQLTAIDPVPFETAEIESLGARPNVDDPTLMLVRVAVVATDSDGAGIVMHYTLTVQQRSERWEVVELMGATPLGEQVAADDGEPAAGGPGPDTTGTGTGTGEDTTDEE
jgi:hypothetical protein